MAHLQQEQIFSVDDGTNRKRSRGETEEQQQRREERKAANRRSAHRSRLRKKLLVEELMQKVSDLNRVVEETRAENRSLVLQLEGALAENTRLQYVQSFLVLGRQQAERPSSVLSSGQPVVVPSCVRNPSNVSSCVPKKASLAACASSLPFTTKKDVLP